MNEEGTRDEEEEEGDLQPDPDLRSETRKALEEGLYEKEIEKKEEEEKEEEKEEKEK